MSDDIVTRLRGYDWMRDGDTTDTVIAEAADEIERLRTALRLMAIAYAQDIGLYTDEEHIKEMVCNYYREAVRGE